MGEIVTRAEFARRMGMDRSAVTHAVRCKRIPSVDGNIDIDDPAVQAWMDLRSRQSPASGGRRGRPVNGGNAPPVDVPESPPPVAPMAQDAPDAGAASGRPLDAASQGKQLDNRIKAVKLAERKLRYLEQTKTVIPVEHVSRTLSRLSSVLDENLRAFHDRHGHELHEAARRDEVQPWSALLASRLDTSVRVVLSTIDRELDAMKQETPS